MSYELRQNMKLSQQLVMTPQLQQAIKLLQLSRLELLDVIRQELEENPVLEEIQEYAAEVQGDEVSEMTVTDDNPVREIKVEDKLADQFDWSNYIEEYNTPGKYSYENEVKDSPRYDSFIAKKESLGDHLFWQMLMTSPNEEEKKITSVIIGNLNKDGFIELTLDEIVNLSGSVAEKAEQVLSLLQSFDPVGVCARNLQESLLIQAKYYGYGDHAAATEIIKHHLTHLENKNYKAIAKALKTDIKDVIDAVNIIKGFEPKPGRSFEGDDPQYITPDIFLYKLEDDFVIVLNDDGMPRLKINTYFNDTLNKTGMLSESAKEFMQEKLKSAAWLIKSIHQRQRTIYRVMDSILNFQRDFFEKGIQFLKPLVLKDVALDIGMHESTISRVTTNKYVLTPQGIFELKFFFNTSIQGSDGEVTTSVNIMEMIKKIIDNEDQQHPYSDDKLAVMLKEQNIDIARRTVAKYREMLGILSSNKRRQM